MTSAMIMGLLSNPDFINFSITAITFIAGIFSAFIMNRKKLKDSTNYNDFNLLVQIAKEESIKLVSLNMSNDEKRNAVIKNIITRLPEKVKNNVSQEIVNQALTLAYQHFIKKDIEEKK